MVLKKVYLKKVLVILKVKKPYNNEFEKCNLNLAKTQRSISKPKNLTICQIYIEKDMFD